MNERRGSRSTIVSGGSLRKSSSEITFKRVASDAEGVEILGNTSNREIPGTAIPASRACSRGGPLDDSDLLVGQPVELVDQLVDLPVGGGDLAFDGGLFCRVVGGAQSLIELEHFRNERHNCHETSLRGSVRGVDL